MADELCKFSLTVSLFQCAV